MANLYTNKRFIDLPLVEVELSKSLSKIVDLDKLEKVEKQINKLPNPVPEINFATGNRTLINTFAERRKMSGELLNKAKNTGVARIFVAYEPNETYSLGNGVGKVWDQTSTASGKTYSGLILLNDKRYQQVADGDETYMVNLILHEVLHVYGLAHAEGIPFNKISNNPVMNIGKFGRLGLAHDDRAGLREIYNVPKRKKVCVEIQANGARVGLVNREKKNKSQGKALVDGKAVFPYVNKGKYQIWIDGKRVTNRTFNKDKVVNV